MPTPKDGTRFTSPRPLVSPFVAAIALNAMRDAMMAGRSADDVARELHNAVQQSPASTPSMREALTDVLRYWLEHAESSERMERQIEAYKRSQQLGA